MTSYAELLQTCTEFQGNFAVLNAKYNAAAEALKVEQEHVERLQRKQEAVAKSEQQLLEEVGCLKKELANSQSYKDRYLAATVSLEHLKGRLESTKRALSDSMVERDQQVDQLKEQIQDLVKRLDATSGEARVREAKTHIAELEERCAIQNVQLSEERERASQQLLAAHNALREQQSRNLELEQRYRAMEAEVTEMRSTVRRAADLQNEAALLKERHASQATLAQREADSLHTEVETRTRAMTQQRQQHEAALAECERQFAEERKTLRARVAALSATVAEATQELTRGREAAAQARRSEQQRVDAARDEASAEVCSLRRALSVAKEEAQRLSFEVECKTEEVDEARREAQQQRGALAALVTRHQHLEKQHDALVQQEAWTSAEKTHLSEQVAALQRQVEELSAGARAHEQATYELERLQLLLSGRDAELAEARRYAQSAEQSLVDLEEASTRRLREVRHELRNYKKQAKLEAGKAESLRRKLIHVLAEQEARQRQCDYAITSGGAPMLKRSINVSASVLPPVDAGHTCDVISLLKSQNEQAEQLHTRLVELSRA